MPKGLDSSFRFRLLRKHHLIIFYQLQAQQFGFVQFHYFIRKIVDFWNRAWHKVVWANHLTKVGTTPVLAKISTPLPGKFTPPLWNELNTPRPPFLSLAKIFLMTRVKSSWCLNLGLYLYHLQKIHLRRSYNLLSQQAHCQKYSFNKKDSVPQAIFFSWGGRGNPPGKKNWHPFALREGPPLSDFWPCPPGKSAKYSKKTCKAI